MSSDLRTLLQDADPGSWEPLDLNAVVREARLRTRQRRIFQALAGVAGVVAVALASPSMFRQLGIQKVDTADRPPTELSQDASGGDGSRSDSLGPGSVSVDGSRGAGGTSSSGGSKSDSVTNPAGDRIVFVAGAPAHPEIYVMNFDGSGRTLLGDGGEPDWSPDGTHIAYSLSGTNASCGPVASLRNPNPCDIWVMKSDGSSKRLVAAGWSPDWSPDGRRIVFAQGEGDSEIYVMNADGSGTIQLTDSAELAWSPDWSPESTRIAFWRADPDGCGPNCFTYQIFLMSEDGSGQKMLTTWEGWDPAWSPDGTRITFSSVPRNGDDNYEIYIIGSDGSDLRRLTRDAQPGSPLYNFDRGPAWAPDGRIIFSRDPDGEQGVTVCYAKSVSSQPECGTGGPAPSEIYEINADGSGLKHIVQGGGPAFAPQPR